MISKTMLAAAGALVLAATAAFAQEPPSPHNIPDLFAFKTDKELKDMVTKPGATGTVLGPLSEHEMYYIQASSRTQSGEPEYHVHWIDYVMIQEGHGTLVYGKSDPTARETSPGEMRGGTITDPQTRELNPGDYFEMPQGIFHQILLKPDTKFFRYYVFKVRR